MSFVMILYTFGKMYEMERLSSVITETSGPIEIFLTADLRQVDSPGTNACKQVSDDTNDVVRRNLCLAFTHMRSSTAPDTTHGTSWG